MQISILFAMSLARLNGDALIGQLPGILNLWSLYFTHITLWIDPSIYQRKMINLKTHAQLDE